MYLYVNGGRKLNGEVSIRSAKNSILPIIASSILSKETIVLRNCPKLSDIFAMLDIIRSMGGRAEFNSDEITINCADLKPSKIESRLTSPIRSSIFILGPLLSRFREAYISSPGGCEIGSRPIDLHLSGLESLGVDISFTDSIIVCKGENIRSGEINLAFPSVGATENLMMASCFLQGTTTITNVAKEPEIEDLANFINYLGGNIKGAGTSKIVIEGVKALRGGEYTPIPDRIVAGTFLTACAISGGKIKLNNVICEHIYSIVDKLQSAGCRFSYKNNSITVSSSGDLRAIERTSTMPYPAFPTDMQPQLVAMLSVAKGKSIITENLFENRFKYTTQLKKMGADIEIIGSKAIISSVPFLRGATVFAEDLRGGAGLVVASLRANGASTINGLEHIDRGYYKIEEDLRALNADILRKT